VEMLTHAVTKCSLGKDNLLGNGATQKFQ